LATARESWLRDGERPALREDAAAWEPEGHRGLVLAFSYDLEQLPGLLTRWDGDARGRGAWSVRLSKNPKL
jgi:hypothetical protein